MIDSIENLYIENLVAQLVRERLYAVLIRILLCIIELMIAFIAWRLSREAPSMSWLKVFAVGMALHGMTLITEQLVAWRLPHGAVTPPLRAFSLVLILYSLLKALNKAKPWILAIIIGSAAYFSIAVASYVLFHLKPMKLWLFDVPHVLLTGIIPLFVAGVLFKAYKETGDPGALAFGAGLIIYSLGIFLGLAVLHSTGSFLLMLVTKDALWTLGFAVMLYGMVSAATK
ncbi:hypothetical protein IPA_02905 [Ignicoccus pacificus DSM 13166]|uniref:Uncharacterized protein n=1 Tax=Ignicoccus pacificus DSM 13166 TaxID=940294 RepID=A0A977KAT5_9CREN|nr:hypothetical protein IPA_02905 [Ignicoccus pacificus DSM 13166]